ncbi:MAG: ubiquitin-like domain-containing protein [Bacillota bacterium]
MSRIFPPEGEKSGGGKGIMGGLRRFFPHKKWLFTAIGIFGLGLGFGWYRAAVDRVCLVVDGKAMVIRTRASRVEGLLREAGIVLREGDEVRPAGNARIEEGLTVKVERAFPVELVIGGVRQRIKTVARPVGELLRSRRIELGPYDRVSPDLGQEVKPGATIRVVRVETKEVRYREEIPPAVVVRKDPNLDRGVRKVIAAGRPGLVERVARLWLEDGRVRGREILSTRWLRRPERRLVALGTRPVIHTFVTSRGQVVRYTEVLEMTATGYYPGPESCGINAKGITRTGARATHGVVAVDPRVIPLGTRLYVEGYGFATALDTGSAIKGKKIDLCFDTYREAIMYGKRKVKVYILAE